MRNASGRTAMLSKRRWNGTTWYCRRWKLMADINANVSNVVSSDTNMVQLEHDEPVAFNSKKRLSSAGNRGMPLLFIHGIVLLGMGRAHHGNSGMSSGGKLGNGLSLMMGRALAPEIPISTTRKRTLVWQFGTFLSSPSSYVEPVRRRWWPTKDFAEEDDI